LRKGERPTAPRRKEIPWSVLHERAGVALLLVAHLALALWGAARSSVTFDENYHLPDGVVVVTQGDFRVAVGNPPLVKSLAACAALAAGARSPDPRMVATHNPWNVGESFMRLNADRYQRVFFAGRVVVALVSVFLGLMVWRFARRLYGAGGGLLALAFYAFSSESLAHAGVVTLDVATGLGVLLSVYAFWIFIRSGRWSAWLGLALAVGFAALTRFTNVLLAPIFVGLLVLSMALHRIARPARAWAGLALLIPSTLAILQVGYLGHTSWKPIGERHYLSRSFARLQHVAPWLRVPLPDPFVEGIDLQMFEGQGRTVTYFLGKIRPGRVWMYFPAALAFKWPLGFLGALGVRAATWPRRRRRRRHDIFVLIPAAMLLLSGMFVLQLNIGVRYLFPIVPLMCVWLGGFIPSPPDDPRATRAGRRWAAIGVTLAALQAVEVLAAAPWYLAFYNRACGGVGGGYRLVNDSNVDWGQGLIALREELARRGIGKIHLAYHGTVDPAIYGIDYVPYVGGPLGAESDWIAISSYYFVGLAQRMTTTQGRSSVALSFDFSRLWNVEPVATPAGCMYLFRIR
jgi:hypothetical protein